MAAACNEAEAAKQNRLRVFEDTQPLKSQRRYNSSVNELKGIV